MRVSVTVNAKILDIAQTIPDTIAAVGPVLYAGMGPSEDEARHGWIHPRCPFRKR